MRIKTAKPIPEMERPTLVGHEAFSVPMAFHEILSNVVE